MRFAAVLAGTAFVVALGAVARAQQPLSGSEAKAFLSGKAFRTQRGDILEFGPTISHTREVSKDKIYLGIYDIEGDKVCMSLITLGRSCYALLKDDQGHFFKGYDEIVRLEPVTPKLTR